MFLFKIGLSRSTRINLLFPFAQMVNSSKAGKLLQFKRWSQIAFSFDGLIFLYVKGDTPTTKFGQSFSKNSFLKQVSLKNKYPLSFINNCFKTFVDKLFIKRPQLTAVERKTLFLSLPYLEEFSLQTRTKLRKSLRKLSNVFHFIDRLPFELVSGVVNKYMCGRCNSTYQGDAIPT